MAEQAEPEQERELNSKILNILTCLAPSMMTTTSQQTELSAMERLLPQVYELLLDPERDITDDTRLQKLLSWFQTTFQNNVQTDQLLAATGILGFLESASTSGQGSCLYLAVRVLPCVASAVSPSMEMNIDGREQPVPGGGTCNSDSSVVEQAGVPTIGTASVHLLHTGRSLLERCRTYSADMSLTHARILTAVELVEIPLWRPILDRLGVMAMAVDLLGHESMFVVNTAEIFLAKVMLLTYSDGPPVAENGLAHSLSKSAGSDEQISRKRQADESHDDQMPNKVPRSKTGANLDVELCNDELPQGELAVVQKWLAEVTSIAKGHLGIYAALLRLSPRGGLGCLMKMDITQTVCASLKTAGPASRSITTTLVCSLLETMSQVSVLPDVCLRFVSAVAGALTSISEEHVQWGVMCLVLPHLWSVCNKCSEDVKTTIFQMFSSVLRTLSDDSRQALSKQEQQSMKYQALLCLDKIVIQGPDPLGRFTPDLVTAVNSHLRWISSHRGSCPHMSRNIKQTLDLVRDILSSGSRSHLRLISETVDGCQLMVPSLLDQCPEDYEAGDIGDEGTVVTSIMHHVLDLISMADCENTILNKGFSIVESYFKVSGEQRNDGFMLTLTNILKKHLVSAHWGVRDSTLHFIGTLMDSPNELVTDWLIEAGFHVHLWEGLDDEENYVRETALRSLGRLTSNRTIFSHFLMRQENLTKISVVEKVLSILSGDTGGFARRAAMKLLCQWLNDDTNLLSFKQEESSEETPVIADAVLLSVASAARDFDWEVKLSALQFWEQFLASIIPGLVTAGCTLESRDSPQPPVAPEDGGKTDVGDSSIPDYAVNLVAGGPTNQHHVLGILGEGKSSKTSSLTRVKARGPVQNGPLQSDRRNPPGLTREVGSHPSVGSVDDNHGEGHRNGSDPPPTCSSEDRDVRTHGGCSSRDPPTVNMSKDGWICELRDHMCLRLLCEKLRDEDGAVCQRAREILLSLREHLVHLSVPDKSSGDSCLANSLGLRAVIDQIEGYGIDDESLDCCPESIVPLLEDVVMMANRGKKIDADCY